MKLAICFYGLTRTWPHIKKYFFDTIADRKNDIDVYIHTWDQDGEENPQHITPEFFEDLNPKKIFIENVQQVIEYLGVGPKYLHQARKRYLVVDLIPKEEHYDHIMLMRFDTVWNYIPTNIPTGTIYNNFTYPGGSEPGDWGFIGNAEDIRNSVNIFLMANPYQLVGYCPHFYLKQSVDMHMLKIVPMIYITIYRYKNFKNLLFDGQVHLERDGKISETVI